MKNFSARELQMAKIIKGQRDVLKDIFEECCSLGHCDGCVCCIDESGITDLAAETLDLFAKRIERLGLDAKPLKTRQT